MNDCLSEIEELVFSELNDLDNGHERMKRILIRFRERFAKGTIYVSFDYNQRNAEIVRRYTGTNERQLAMEFRLSIRQVSKITKTKRLTMQGDLF